MDGMGTPRFRETRTASTANLISSHQTPIIDRKPVTGSFRCESARQYATEFNPTAPAKINPLATGSLMPLTSLTDELKRSEKFQMNTAIVSLLAPKLRTEGLLGKLEKANDSNSGSRQEGTSEPHYRANRQMKEQLPIRLVRLIALSR
jgi:hypothetical protein